MEGVVFMTRNMEGVSVRLSGTESGRTMHVIASVGGGADQQFTLIRNAAELRTQIPCEE